MRTAVIDCAGITSVEEFWQAYLDSTMPYAPGYFGRNLNAFWDAISGGGPGCPVDYEQLNFINLRELVGTDPNGALWYEDFRDLASKAKDIKVTLSLGNGV